MAVTFQSVGQELAVYEPLEVAVDELRTQVENESEAEAQIEVEENDQNENNE